MSRFSGSSCVDVGAPAAVCFELVCDTPRTPQWHQAITAVEVLDRDADGRTSLVRTKVDALVVGVEVILRLSYEEPRIVHMSRESGDLRDLAVTWTFEEVGEGLTRAGFETEFDPGRVLSTLARGPLVAQLRARLAEQPPAGLKRAIEGDRGPASATP